MHKLKTLTCALLAVHSLHATTLEELPSDKPLTINRELIISRYVQEAQEYNSVNFYGQKIVNWQSFSVNGTTVDDWKIEAVHEEALDIIAQRVPTLRFVDLYHLSPQTFIRILSKLSRMVSVNPKVLPALTNLSFSEFDWEEGLPYTDATQALENFLTAYPNQMTLTHDGQFPFPMPPLPQHLEVRLHIDKHVPTLVKEVQRGVFGSVNRLSINLRSNRKTAVKLLETLTDTPTDKPWHELFPPKTELEIFATEIDPLIFKNLLIHIHPFALQLCCMPPKITREVVDYASQHRLEMLQGELEYKNSYGPNTEILHPFLSTHTYPVQWELGHGYYIQTHIIFNRERAAYLKMRDRPTESRIPLEVIQKFVDRALKYPFWYTDKTDTPELPGHELWVLIKEYKRDRCTKAFWPLEEKFSMSCRVSNMSHREGYNLTNVLHAFIQMDYLITDGYVKKVNISVDFPPTSEEMGVIDQFIEKFGDKVKFFLKVYKTPFIREGKDYETWKFALKNFT